MDLCSGRCLSIDHMSLKSVTGYELNMKSRDHAVTNQSASSPRRIICPEPRRAAWAPHVVDRKCGKPNSYVPSNRCDSSLDILNIILAKDELGGNSDDSDPFGFYNGSPPVRTSNPLVHDVQFTRQTSAYAFPSETSKGGAGSVSSKGGAGSVSSAKVDRVFSCGSSSPSFGGKKPLVRIEGFSCRDSKTNCIVPAFG